MHLLGAAHFQILGLVMSFRDFVYRQSSISPYRQNKIYKLFRFFCDLYLLYYRPWISSHQYHESFLKIHEYLSNKALNAVRRTASYFPILLINSDMDIKDQFSLFCIDLSRLDQIEVFLFLRGEKGSNIKDNLVTIEFDALRECLEK
jgi:hypothetical protein